MFGRTVDRVETQRLLSGADDIMPRALRHDDAVIRLDLGATTVDPDLSLSLFDAEKLIAVCMDLFANLGSRRDGHQHQLQIVPRV